MIRIGYFYAKIKRALASRTLLFKSFRFLSILIRRPFEVLVGYMRLSGADRRLNLKDGFADHRQSNSHCRSNPEHLHRIIAAYKAAKQTQPLAPEPFRIKGLWDEWLSINHKALISALENEDVSGLSCLLENLHREQFTTGTGGYDLYLRYRTLLGKFYIRYVWSSYRDKLLTLDVDLRRMSFPMVGNPAGIIMDGSVISIETLRHAYHAAEMCNLLQDVPGATVVEVGGGLGGQAYQTMTLSTQVSKYLIFDIPEVALISSYFLLTAFPHKRIRLFGEGPVSTSPTDEYDVAVFPHFAISQLSALSVDLFYNSCSFSEMDSASSREYLSIIERACRRYFMHDNHDMVLEFSEPDGSKSVNVIGSRLIPDPAAFKRVFKKSRVHGLPEDRGIVQYEYLYERVREAKY